MKVLIVNQAEVRQLLPISECMDVMADALKTLARGDAILPLRIALDAGQRGAVVRDLKPHLSWSVGVIHRADRMTPAAADFLDYTRTGWRGGPRRSTDAWPRGSAASRRRGRHWRCKRSVSVRSSGRPRWSGSVTGHRPGADGPHHTCSSPTAQVGDPGGDPHPALSDQLTPLSRTCCVEIRVMNRTGARLVDRFAEPPIAPGST